MKLADYCRTLEKTLSNYIKVITASQVKNVVKVRTDFSGEKVHKSLVPIDFSDRKCVCQSPPILLP